MLRVSDASSLRKLLGKICIFKCSVLLLFLILARYGSVPSVFAYVIFFLHKLYEVGRICVCLELYEDLIKWRLVLIFTVVVIHSHFKLHFRVKLTHVVSHFVHHIIISFGFNRILVIFKLPCEQVSLSILKLHGLFLFFSFINQAF